MLINDLEYFVRTAESGSFNRAARRLGVSPQAIWARVAAMEKELGSPLLERGPSGVALTAFGRQVCDDARQVLEMHSRWREMGHGRTEAAAPVRLGAATSLTFSVVPSLIAAVKEKDSRLRLELHESFMEDMLQQVTEKRMLGLIPCGSGRAEEHLRSLCALHDMEAERGPDDELLLALNAEHPLARHDSVAPDLLGELRLAWNPRRDKTFVYRDVSRLFREILHVPEMGNLLRLADMQPSIAAIVPQSVLRSHGSGRLRGIRIEGFPMPCRIWLLHPRGLSSAERLVLSCIREILRRPDFFPASQT